MNAKRYRFRPIQDMLRLVFPRNCYSCGKALVGDEHDICCNCLLHLPTTQYSHIDGNTTEQRFMGRFEFEAATSLLYYRKNGSTQRLLHNIKYYGKSELARVMGRQLGQALATSGRFDDVDLLIPIPLHPWKKFKRGYNQSELLCKGIAETFPRPICKTAVKRIANTHSQTHKNRLERMDNMENAFQVTHPDRIKGKHLLVVDDVITTGATVTECCTALLHTGGVHISIASLAIAGD